MAKNKAGITVMDRRAVIKGNRARVRPFVNGTEYDEFQVKTFELNESIETTSLPRLNGAPIVVPGDPTYEGSFTDYLGSPLWLNEVSREYKKTGAYPEIEFLVDFLDSGSDRGTATYEVTGVILTQTPVINIDVESAAVEGSYSFVAEDFECVTSFNYLKGER